jgi:hypothetical protein
MAFTTGRRTAVWSAEDAAPIEALVAADGGDRLLVRTGGDGRPRKLWRIDLEGGPARRVAAFDRAVPAPWPIAASGPLDVFVADGAVVTVDRTRPDARARPVLDLEGRELLPSPAGAGIVSVVRPAVDGAAPPSVLRVERVEIHGLDGSLRARHEVEDAHLLGSDLRGGDRVCVLVTGRLSTRSAVLAVDARSGEAQRFVAWEAPVELTWEVDGGTARATPAGQDFDPAAPTVRDGRVLATTPARELALWPLLGGQFELPAALAEPGPDPALLVGSRSDRVLAILVDALEAARLRPRADLVERLRARGELGLDRQQGALGG